MVKSLINDFCKNCLNCHSIEYNNIQYWIFLKNRNDIYETIFIGFSLLLLFLSFGYFIFDLNVYYLRNILIIVSIFFIYNLKNKNFISEYFKIFYVIIIPVLFYSLYISLYGEQFFIF